MRARWPEVRYRWLLPLARRGRAHGRAYAQIVARVEHAADAERRRVAEARIARALGVDAATAATIYRRCLASEALEEADSVFFMQRTTLDRALFRIDALPPVSASAAAAGAGTIYGTLHFGSPVLGYLALACARGEQVAMVGRPLDDSNPMPEAKRAYARGKVRWVETLAGRPFLSTDAGAIALARDELLAGRALYTPIDVPGSVAGRAATVTMVGERVRFASGLMTLARLTGAAVVPTVTLSRPDAFVVHFGRRFEPGAGDAALLADAIADLERFVRAHPDEWWMWPYLEVAR